MPTDASTTGDNERELAEKIVRQLALSPEINRVEAVAAAIGAAIPRLQRRGRKIE